MKFSVSGLPKDLFEADVEALFAPYGRVSFVAVYFDSISMKNRGKAMVEMRNQEEAERALEALDGKMIGQNTLKIKVEKQMPFTPRRNDGYDRGNNSRPPYGGGGGGFNRGGGGGGDDYPRMRKRMPLKRNDND